MTHEARTKLKKRYQDIVFALYRMETSNSDKNGEFTRLQAKQRHIEKLLDMSAWMDLPGPRKYHNGKPQMIMFRGKYRTIREIAKMLNYSYSAVRSRVKNGLPPDHNLRPRKR